MDESLFNHLADKAINHLMEAIESQLGDVMDVDMEGGILNLDLDNGGQYIINKHAASRQIWVSSPVSGAGHYNYVAEIGRWIALRDGADLYQKLEDDLVKAGGGKPKLG